METTIGPPEIGLVDGPQMPIGPRLMRLKQTLRYPPPTLTNDARTLAIQAATLSHASRRRPISHLYNARLTLPRRIATLLPVTDDPVLIAYAVKRSPRSKKAIWTRVGRAYPHETGAGLTVLLDAVPADGRIILLERDDADDARLQREAMRRQK
ncbi:MAG: hypothetical protein K8F62_13530 [Pseudorhodoplanes sp.]|nr:hypothetical protein [Pseudorhodoplanes sp.]